jgi:hypothetical protein
MRTYTVTLVTGEEITVTANQVLVMDEVIRFYDRNHHDAHEMFPAVNVLRVHLHRPTA